MISRRSFSRHFEEIFCGNYSMGNVSNGGGGVGILHKTQNKEEFLKKQICNVHYKKFMLLEMKN